jgi:pimeloyl-ACP methyl ester carboxylesterase
MKIIKIRNQHELSLLSNEDEVSDHQSTPAFFLPGMCSEANQFLIWMKIAKFRTYALDYRSRKTSSVVNLRASLKDYIEDVKNVISQLGWQLGPMCLCGHSMGGLIAQIAACEPSIRPFVRKVVLLASTPPAPIRIPFRINFLRPRYLLAMVLNKPFSLHQKEKRLFCYPLEDSVCFCKESGRVARDVLFGNWLRRIKVDRLPAYVPVLVVAGTFDQIFQTHVQQQLAKYHLGSLYKEVSTGHMIHCSRKGDSFFREVIEPWCLS